MRITFILLFFFNFSIFIHAQTAPWFRDDFNSNEQNWFTDSTTHMKCFMRDGHYIFINKDETKTVNYVYKNIYMDPAKDFSLEIKLKIPVSKGDGTAGLYITNEYGMKDFFCINPYNNSFSAGIMSSSTSWTNLTGTEIGETNSGWQLTDAFTSATDYQIIKLQKKSDLIHLYINDTEVKTIGSDRFCQMLKGSIGFITFTKMELVIDYIVFYQDNLQNVLATDAAPIASIRMPTTINTYADEITPVLSPDKKTLYFTRINHKDNYPLDDAYNGTQNGDIYYSEYIDSTWTEAQRLEYGISNGGNNAIVSMAPDGNSMLLVGTYSRTRSYSDLGEGLAISHRVSNGWSYPQNIHIRNFYTFPTSISYFLADNGRVLILAIKRDDSKGKDDLYVSFKQKDNSWSEPKNMGRNINTSNHECTPFLSSDNKTLYYATSDLPGYGSADTYITKRLDDTWTNWSTPVNLGPAINDEGWNAYFRISTDASVLYYSATKNSIGGTDIFMAELPKALRPEPVTMIKGHVLDAKTKRPLEAFIHYENLGDSSAIGDCRSTPLDGSYAIVLPYGSTYGYYAKADGYISINENINLQESNDYQEISKDIYLVPIEVGQIISLNNIFFVRSKAELLPISYPELDRLVKALKENPTLEIEIRGHTDTYGDSQANMLLSEQRAKVVVDYLIQNGIKKSRISAKGYGDSQPIASNDTEANREKNRRVEFVIIKK
ncbi:OmpA family protein [Cytophaga aurantiaca]|uniref:OmpA family protein n=1 Tax=Cytophaga aurantiaca TaxID=29530 RepID=UPI0003673763|nr:OmpA family protein [Cytophaga aurantiaca]